MLRLKMFKWIKKNFYKPVARQDDYINGVFGKNAVASANELFVLYKEHCGISEELMDFDEVACVVGFLVVHSLSRWQYETKLTDEQEFQIGVGVYLKACYLSAEELELVSKINQFNERFVEYKLVWRRMQYSKSMAEMAELVSSHVVKDGGSASAVKMDVNAFSKAIDKMIIQISRYCE